MRRKLFLVAVIAAIATPAAAQRQGPAYQKMRTKARTTMSKAKTEAAGVRKSIPKLQALESKMQGRLRKSENAETGKQVKELRSLRQSRTAADGKVKHKLSRSTKLRAAQTKADTAAGSRSIRNLGKWFSKAGRAQLRAARGARKRAKRIQRLVEISDGQVARATAAFERIDQRAGAMEKAIKASWAMRKTRSQRATQAAKSEQAAMRKRAAAIEAAAKDQVRNMVVSWAAEHLPSYQKLVLVKARTKAADGAAKATEGEADSTLSAMRRAKSKVDDASLAETADATDSFLPDNNFSSAIQTFNSVNSTMAIQDAKSAVQRMNRQVKTLASRHKELKNKLDALGKSSRATAPGQARLSSTAVTLEHLDLVLDLSRMQTGIMDLAFGLSTVSQLDSNSRSIGRAMDKTRTMVRDLKKTRSMLQKNLEQIDAESARIVGQVVKNVLQD